MYYLFTFCKERGVFHHSGPLHCYVLLFNVIEWHDTGAPDISELWTPPNDSDKVFWGASDPDSAMSFCNWLKTFPLCHLIITHQRKREEKYKGKRVAELGKKETVLFFVFVFYCRSQTAEFLQKPCGQPKSSMLFQRCNNGTLTLGPFKNQAWIESYHGYPDLALSTRQLQWISKI